MNFSYATSEVFDEWQGWDPSTGMSISSQNDQTTSDTGLPICASFVGWNGAVAAAIPSNPITNPLGRTHVTTYQNDADSESSVHSSTNSMHCADHGVSRDHIYTVDEMNSTNSCSYPSRYVPSGTCVPISLPYNGASVVRDTQPVVWSGYLGASGSHSHMKETSVPALAQSSSVISDANASTSASTSSGTFEQRNSRSDPPAPSPSDDLKPRRQSPRFAGDEYTATWVRGEGIDRAGWCGVCSSWHKLKDSAYWYHMHYSHGISCATGKAFAQPGAWRPAEGAVGSEVLCGGCAQWVYVGRSERWHTPYYRHAYKCLTRKKSSLDRSQSMGKIVSPRKAQAKLVRSP